MPGVVSTDAPRLVDLVHNFGSGSAGVFGAFDAGGGDAGPDGSAALGAPPVEEFAVALRAGYPPIELWGHVVTPSFLEPLSGIGREVFVSIDGGCGAGGHTWFPDPKRTDSDPYPWFGFFDGAVHVVDKSIDIRASLRWFFAIGKLSFWVVVFIEIRVGVKIIIDVNAIDIVAAGDIGDDREGAALGEAFGWVHPLVSFEFFDHRRVGAGDVVFCRGLAGIRQGAEWVEPGVHFDAPGVGLGNTVGKGVVSRGFAHGARQPMTPGLDLGLVKRVSIGANLKNDRIEIESGRLVKQGAEFSLLCRSGESFAARPIDIIHAGYPGGAEFTGDNRGAFLS